MTKDTILIAGATGTNGRALVEALTGENVTVRALVRSGEDAAKLFDSTVQLVTGDLADKESLKRAFAGVDKAYIVTAVLPNVVDLFANFFEAAKAAGVKHLVKFSGLGADKYSDSEVIRQHAQSDDLLKKSGIPYTIIRPNSFHQNMLRQAAAIAEGDAFYLPLGGAKQSTIDVRDIAEITAKILLEAGHENKAYDLTGPEGLTFHEVARIIGKVRGRPVSYVPVSEEDAKSAMLAQGMPEWSAQALAEIQGVFATGLYAKVLPDAERLLGRKPTSFKQFVEDHKASFGG